MSNPSNDTRRAEARNIKKLNSSLPQSSVSAQYPVLPEHLDKLIDQPWTSEANRQIDWWLWRVQQEFETAGGVA